MIRKIGCATALMLCLTTKKNVAKLLTATSFDRPQCLRIPLQEEKHPTNSWRAIPPTPKLLGDFCCFFQALARTDLHYLDVLTDGGFDSHARAQASKAHGGGFATDFLGPKFP